MFVTRQCCLLGVGTNGTNGTNGTVPTVKGRYSHRFGFTTDENFNFLPTLQARNNYLMCLVIPYTSFIYYTSIMGGRQVGSKDFFSFFDVQ